MYYEINVSKNGTHYFATSDRSLREEATALKVYWDLFDRFPASEGFKLMLTRCESIGYQITPKRRKKAS